MPKKEVLYKVTLLTPEFQRLYERADHSSGTLVRSLRGDESATAEENVPTSLEGITAVELGFLITYFAYKGKSMEEILNNIRYERTSHRQPREPKWTPRSPEELPKFPKAPEQDQQADKPPPQSPVRDHEEPLSEKIRRENKELFGG